jgi:Zn-dependent M28 family amino/carboxypeptidase
VLPYLHRANPKLQPLTDQERQLAAALRRDVEVLASDIGPRGTFAPDRYALAADFIESALSRAGYSVSRQWFEAVGVNCCNLEVSIRGTRDPGKIVILGAHYDSVEGCPAANDNASGVAGVLAIARALAGSQPAATLRFVLFANEEPPFFNFNEMGSQEYARRSRKGNEDICAMVCLETIGCYKHEEGSQVWPFTGMGLVLPTIGDFITFVGPTDSRQLIRAAAEAFDRQLAFPLLAAAAPAAIDHINWSDHRGFNEQGYQAFMVTDTAPFRYEHYHRESDTPEKLDYESMARVVRGLIGTVADLANTL